MSGTGTFVDLHVQATGIHLCDPINFTTKQCHDKILKHKLTNMLCYVDWLVQ